MQWNIDFVIKNRDSHFNKKGFILQFQCFLFMHWKALIYCGRINGIACCLHSSIRMQFEIIPLMKWVKRRDYLSSYKELISFLVCLFATNFLLKIKCFHPSCVTVDEYRFLLPIEKAFQLVLGEGGNDLHWLCCWLAFSVEK